MISHDMIGKRISFLNSLLPLRLPQRELSKAAASLPTVIRRQGTSLSSYYVQGGRKKDCLPRSSLLQVQRLPGEEGAAGRQQLTASLPDVCSVYRGEPQDSQLPCEGLLLRVCLL